jgi:pyruvate,water dikinase
MTFVLQLARSGATDRKQAGGKAACLGELARAGIPVPRGFVVTATAFGRAMAVLDPRAALPRELEELPPDDVTAIAGTAARIRGLITVAPLPGDVAAEITTWYNRLGAGSVAVRSSATMEDSAEASFAGLQDTYLAVRGPDAVLDRVRACWASLYNGESVIYRRRIGLPEHGLAMGVIVQEMVRPRAAGVMFTRSPVTGDRSVVAIEGTWGLGSALVAGEVTPDGFAVSKVTGEITGRRLGAKLRIHSFDPNGVGVTVRDTPPALRGKPCLTDDQVRELARLARRVEDHYRAAQDIEWALLRDGRVVLLQARPETVWAARDAAPVAAPKPRASDHVLAMFGTTRRWN